MHPTIIKELITLVVIIIFVALYYASLAPMAYILCSLVVALMTIVFIANILKKTDRDEREERHRTIAAEAGYIATGVIVLVGIIYGTFSHHSVDPWLFIILVVMLAARLIARIYLDSKK